MTLTYGLLSTYPPTACGLATFTSSLAAELSAGAPGRDARCHIVRALEAPGQSPPEVVATLLPGSPASRSDAAAALNDADVAIVQHEYGIFGGQDGDDVLPVLRSLTVPVIVVLHTVLTEPTPHQKQVLEEVVDAADAVITMTQTARRRLASGYEVDLRKIRVIPHGAHVAPGETGLPTDADHPTILTWGLIGPGKGIEWGIEALALLQDLEPKPRYQIVGKTHPKVLDASGEVYRNSLQARADRLGVSADVEFDASYLDVASLQRIVRRATVVLLPYDSPDQITSGVLIEAVAAGKPVISTPFPHAAELLGGGLGLLVGHQDPAAIADALRLVLTDPARRAAMATASGRLAPGLAWSAVAEGYRIVAGQLMMAQAVSVA